MGAILPILKSFGGLETDGEVSTRTPGRARTCLNMEVGQGGKTLKKARGASAFFAGQVNGSQPILALKHYTDKSGTVHVIARVPGGYYERDAGADTWTILSGSPTARQDDAVPMWEQANGKLFIVDGYGAYTYDGTTFADWSDLTPPETGIVSGTTDRPSAAPSTSTGLTANADYEVFYVFADNANTTIQSPPSRIMRVHMGASNLRITISTGYEGRNGTDPRTSTNLFHLPTDVAALGANGRMFAYISAANTPGVWYRVTEKAINDEDAEQTIVISAEGTANQFQKYFGPPRYSSGLVTHFDRLWVWGSPHFPSRIWFTETDEPETFRASNFLDLDPDNPADPIVSSVRRGAGAGAELIVLKRNTVWTVQGNHADTFLASRIRQGPSCVSELARVEVDGRIFFAGFEDVYSYDGQTVVSILRGRTRDAWRTAMAAVNVS